MSDGIMLTAGMDFSNEEDCTMLTLIVDGKPDHVSCDTPWGRAVVDLLSERDKSADELARLRAEVERLNKERDQWRNDCLDANQSELMLRKRAELAEAALADERAHADALAETLESCPPFRAFDHVTREYVLFAHRARRQG